MDFEFKEDEQFFGQLLQRAGGLHANADLFDRRDPALKRTEFAGIRDAEFERLRQEVGDRCELQCHPDCSGRAEQVDHLIPLSSNELNKTLRRSAPARGRKVAAQSFGSNALANLVLSCRRCNAFKKHRLPDAGLVARILTARRLAADI